MSCTGNVIVTVVKYIGVLGSCFKKAMCTNIQGVAKIPVSQDTNSNILLKRKPCINMAILVSACC